MSPFTASLDPLAFMRRVLDGIGQADFELTGPPEKAAIVFLQRLTALGFAGYDLEADELEISPGDPGSFTFSKSKSNIQQ
ncbi:MAG: hypothetical protein E7055_21150 [Lentisphaerae bacterium]|nr:hypothetical protein [Lentisphaerota bacterium]